MTTHLIGCCNIHIQAYPLHLIFRISCDTKTGYVQNAISRVNCIEDQQWGIYKIRNKGKLIFVKMPTGVPRDLTPHSRLRWSFRNLLALPREWWFITKNLLPPLRDSSTNTSWGKSSTMTQTILWHLSPLYLFNIQCTLAYIRKT